mmetsp:Transcript_26667/g.64927  ORF Transcript_26667/g.64927 Transcript_26667/m.64927 type:complete len:91 (+) Transcript_26667:173-445(+)
MQFPRKMEIILLHLIKFAPVHLCAVSVWRSHLTAPIMTTPLSFAEELALAMGFEDNDTYLEERSKVHQKGDGFPDLVHLLQALAFGSFTE